MIGLFLAALIGCGGAVESEAVSLAAEPIGLAECAVCGMVVGEQPSPRGQLVYRDGTHAHTCSLEEVRALAAAPGGRGRAVRVFVEAVPRDFDWAAHGTDPLPWMAADEAHFVFGAPRTRVMGVPVLSFADPADAKAVADELGSNPVRWTDLLTTPVPLVPPSAGWAPKP